MERLDGRGSGTRVPVLGRWRLDVRTGQASFDDDAIAMYDVGLEPVCDPAVLRRHMHHADNARLAHLTAEALASPAPVTARYRVHTFTRGLRTFFVACDPVLEDGEVVALAGVSVDVTDWTSPASADALDRALADHAAVEQVKGALIAVYNLDSQLASEVLRLRASSAGLEVTAYAVRVLTRLTDANDRIRRHDGGLPLLRLLDEVAIDMGRDEPLGLL